MKVGNEKKIKIANWVEKWRDVRPPVGDILPPARWELVRRNLIWTSDLGHHTWWFMFNVNTPVFWWDRGIGLRSNQYCQIMERDDIDEAGTRDSPIYTRFYYDTLRHRTFSHRTLVNPRPIKSAIRSPLCLLYFILRSPNLPVVLSSPRPSLADSLAADCTIIHYTGQR